MSARNNSRYVKSAPKPFCKVCQDAGKTEKEYTSHFVKSDPGPNGKVVCPTLLAQECRFCFEHGHTAGYCPAIAANKKAEEKSLKLAAQREAIEKKQVTKPVVVKTSINAFAALDESSDTEEPEVKVSKKVTKSTTKAPIVATKVVTAKEDFPALSSNTKTVTATPLMTGYASAAAKTPEEYETARYEQQLIVNSMKRQMPPIKTQMVSRQVADEEWDANSDSEDSWEEAAVAPTPTPRPVFKVSLLDWAATVDSDDEDW